MKPKNIVIVLFCHFSAVRIGYVETSFSVCETEPDIVLEIQLLEGTIAPKCGNIVVSNVSTLTRQLCMAFRTTSVHSHHRPSKMDSLCMDGYATCS